MDSVAEHQATRDEMYFQFFECACYFGPIGLLGMFWNRNDAKMFLLVYRYNLHTCFVRAYMNDTLRFVYVVVSLSSA